MKSYSKSEIAQTLGISTTTFNRWLRPLYPRLLELGIPTTAKLLPPAGVRLLCDHFCIDPDELPR